MKARSTRFEPDLSPAHAAAIVAATVHLPDLDGQGVLVRGGFVLTAAHCVKWDGEGGMALGDHHTTTVVTPSGARFRLDVVAAEPRADIAVLGALDEQLFGSDSDAFESWRETTSPVEVADVKLEPDEPMPAHVLAHTGVWIPAAITRYCLGLGNGVVSIKAKKPIRGGTSGGPIVDAEGKLIGVVSHASDAKRGTCEGFMPIARQALPGWVWAQIVAARNEE